jgi:excinuclease ABC subunit B
MTDSMRRAIDETERRRAIQRAYNEENGITPESIVRPLEYSLAKITDPDATELTEAVESVPDFNSQEDLDKYIAKLEQQMREAAKRFEFETAAKLRDTIKDLRSKEILII